VLERAKAHLAPLFEQGLVGLTVQIDESPGQVYDGKHSTLHPHFNKT
jgi:5-carboxymethyl-2-hydroxymuconate isomerase